MPLLLNKQLASSTNLAVWDAEEEDDFFVSALKLNNEEKAHIDSLKKHRRKEWLGSRYLCHLLLNSGERLTLLKDDHGKPYIKDCKFHISISHSRSRVAVIISENSVGIDIQQKVEKIYRIKHKFISEEEFSNIDNDHLQESYHIFWGSKECMYKAYGKKEIDFKKHMHLYPFKYFDDKLRIKGWLRKDNISQDYNVYTEELDNYYLVSAILQR